MLKLLRLAWKEIKLIKSQRIALAMILIYPVLIVLTLALAFSGNELFGDTFGQSGLDKVDIAIYLPSESKNFDSADFWEKISGYENVNLLNTKNPELVKEAIRMNIARVGIVVGEPGAGNKQVDVNLFLDNSSLLASKTIASYAYIGLENVRYKKSQEILQSIWQDIESIQKRLYAERGKIDEFSESLSAGKKRLLLLKEKINSIETKPLIEKTEEFDAEYEDTKKTIELSRQDIANSKEDLAEYETKLLSTKGKLVYYKQKLVAIRDSVSDAKSMTTGAVYTELDQIEHELTQTISDIDNTIQDIEWALQKIDETEIKLDQATANLALADKRLDDAKATVEDFHSLLEYLEATILETNEMIDEALVSQELLEEDLQNTKKLVNSLIATLGEFQQYDPGFLVNPLNTNEFKMYPVNDLAIMSPTSLSLVLLLTCVLLSGVSVLRERSYGVNFRARLSPTSKTEWITGKILGQMVFAFFEAVIIFILVFFVFGSPLAGSVVELFIVLASVSFCFISLGIFLTNFTKTESTLILSSLVLMIPMIFLSGIIFPIEFMPFAIRAIAEFLPLTIAINLFSSVMVKGTSIVHSVMPFAALLTMSFVMLLFSLFKKEY